MPEPDRPADETPVEPILETRDIQGNIFPGFNKSHQLLLGLRITDPPAARAWIRFIATEIATADEVLRFNQLRRSMIDRRGREPDGLVATWTSIAFSSDGLRKLGREDVDFFEDEAFRAGLPERSTLLGDPDDQDDLPGSRKNWKVGGKPETVPDVFLIVASDDPAQLDAKVQWIKAGLERLPASTSDPAGESGLECFYEERGEDLPGELGGHEHFGFKDGVSQPGVRGRLPDPPQEFLTPGSSRRMIRRRGCSPGPASPSSGPASSSSAMSRRTPCSRRYRDRRRQRGRTGRATDRTWCSAGSARTWRASARSSRRPRPGWPASPASPA